jgi:hypothetical protein
MRSAFPHWTALAAATALSVASMLPQNVAAQVAPICAFQNGFAFMGQALGQDIVGNCRDNEHFNPMNGNIEQLTSSGLLFWRKCDNTTAFTNGYVTWLNGPNGIQNRLAAGPLLDWEPIDPAAPPCAQLPSLSPSSTASVSIPVAPTPAAPVLPVKPNPDACPANTVSIRNTDLSNLDRRGVNYMCADAYHAKFGGTDFSGANLAQAMLEGADVSRANFYGARLTLSVLIALNGTGSNFTGADLRGAKLSTAKLASSDFRYADLSNADLSRASLVGSDLRGTDLRGADLSQANFSSTNLTGAYLCGANTTGTTFTKAIGVSTSCG